MARYHHLNFDFWLGWCVDLRVYRGATYTMARITDSKIRCLTKEELRAQRRSWVAAESGFGSDADEAAYRAAYERGDTTEMARLDAEAEKRKQRAIKCMGK
jgi:hypothetical protein